MCDIYFPLMTCTTCLHEFPISTGTIPTCLVPPEGKERSSVFKSSNMKCLGTLTYMILFGWVLQHINHCRLFNAKSSLY